MVGCVENAERMLRFFTQKDSDDSEVLTNVQQIINRSSKVGRGRVKILPKVKDLLVENSNDCNSSFVKLCPAFVTLEAPLVYLRNFGPTHVIMGIKSKNQLLNWGRFLIAVLTTKNIYLTLRLLNYFNEEGNIRYSVFLILNSILPS
jgi:hypothetical protein